MYLLSQSIAGQKTGMDFLFLLPVPLQMNAAKFTRATSAASLQKIQISLSSGFPRACRATQPSAELSASGCLSPRVSWRCAGGWR